jgi:hypothetical protein
MPGRMVGLTIPTTPRQLENDMNVSFRVITSDISLCRTMGKR